MKRAAIVIVLSLAVLWPPSSPCAAGFIATTDRNKIPGPVIGMIWNRPWRKLPLKGYTYRRADGER
jgi:hypothetical protein